VAPPILAGRVDQLLDLSLGQILPRTPAAIATRNVEKWSVV